MSEIRIGRLVSRATDVEMLRSGRSQIHQQRLILLCDESGCPMSEVCRVSFPTDVPHTHSIKKLENIMRCLDAGLTALN
jgi:hypothetical protein